MIELNERHSAEFFVVIGVFCFLYSLGVLICYIAFQEDVQVQAAPTGGYLNPPVIVRKIYLTFILLLFYSLSPEFFFRLVLRRSNILSYLVFVTFWKFRQ